MWSALPCGGRERVSSASFVLCRRPCLPVEAVILQGHLSGPLGLGAGFGLAKKCSPDLRPGHAARPHLVGLLFQRPGGWPCQRDPRRAVHLPPGRRARPRRSIGRRAGSRHGGEGSRRKWPLPRIPPGAAVHRIHDRPVVLGLQCPRPLAPLAPIAPGRARAGVALDTLALAYLMLAGAASRHDGHPEQGRSGGICLSSACVSPVL